MNLVTFQKRIDYSGDISLLVKQIVVDYKLGEPTSFKVILQGYEDFNIIIETSQGKYLAKVFADFRTLKDCKNYVNIMEHVIEAGIAHPKLYKGPKEYLHTIAIDKEEVNLCVMDFIEGQDFFQLDEKPSHDEMIFITQQAAKINSLTIKPKHVYDSWAIPNILNEYRKVEGHLEADDKKLIQPLIENFREYHIDKLPHAFIHGDIIATNVIRSTNDELYIIDFAVANWYPRIQELAVLMCDLLYVEDKDQFLSNYELALNEYQKILELEDREIEFLPTYIMLAHAMHIIPATREKLAGNKLPENEFWLKSGQVGLRFMNQIWA